MTKRHPDTGSETPEALQESPWDALDDSGTDLTVDNFLTTRMSQTINLLRRTVTLPYAREAGLTVSEWRILSLVAHAQSIPFAELVAQSSSDKALVSRTVRLLEQRALVRTESEGNTPRKRLTVFITPQGDALHARVIPIARRQQAEMILVMSPDERRGMYHGLRKLAARCAQAAPGGDDTGDGSDA